MTLRERCFPFRDKAPRFHLTRKAGPTQYRAKQSVRISHPTFRALVYSNKVGAAIQTAPTLQHGWQTTKPHVNFFHRRQIDLLASRHGEVDPDRWEAFPVPEKTLQCSQSLSRRAHDPASIWIISQFDPLPETHPRGRLAYRIRVCRDHEKKSSLHCLAL